MTEQMPMPANDTPSPPRRRGWLTLLPLLLFVSLAALFVKQLLFEGDPSRVPSPLIGQPIPEFNLKPLVGLDGPDGPVPGLSSADLRKGEVNLVNVWASWCVPCRDEQPVLMDMALKHGIRLVSINYKDAPENALRFLGTLGVPFKAVGVDANGRAAIDWGVYGVPESFVVDGSGFIRFKQIGPIANQAQLDKLLAELA
jgi:cytochrome c biogenesis protein CcmG/thiol:disulfide interchange protein DsbE